MPSITPGNANQHVTAARTAQRQLLAGNTIESLPSDQRPYFQAGITSFVFPAAEFAELLATEGINAIHIYLAADPQSLAPTLVAVPASLDAATSRVSNIPLSAAFVGKQYPRRVLSESVQFSTLESQDYEPESFDIINDNPFTEPAPDSGEPQGGDATQSS